MRILLLCLVLLGLHAVLVVAPTPSAKPTRSPTQAPTFIPTYRGTSFPTSMPTVTQWPTPAPSANPTTQPTVEPSTKPTGQPTGSPTIVWVPTLAPTPRPTTVGRPTFAPSVFPTQPTRAPTQTPTRTPTRNPTQSPTGQPTGQPTSRPTKTRAPAWPPTPLPTVATPTRIPTVARPSGQPTGQPTREPSKHPTPAPSISRKPTRAPQPTGQPTSSPTPGPSVSYYPTKLPTGQPTSQPTGQPSIRPTRAPTGQPTMNPTSPSGQPTGSPTGQPSGQPTRSPQRVSPVAPTPLPTTYAPSNPTIAPTTASPNHPSGQPTGRPSGQPTGQPTGQPERQTRPSGQPSRQPTGQPTSRPTSWDERDRISNSPTAMWSRDSISAGTVNYDPVDGGVCTDTEIKIKFTMALKLNVDAAYRINTPGIKQSDCGLATSDWSNSTHGTKLLASWPFTVTFFEGKAEDTYLGSYIIAENLERQIPPGTSFDLILDRSNGLKRTCPRIATWNVYRYIVSPLYNRPYPTAAPSAGPDPNEYVFNEILQVYAPVFEYPTSMPTGAVQINLRENWESGLVGSLTQLNNFENYVCFFYSADLSFSPALMHFDTTVNLTLNMGFTIKSGDRVRLSMPGFTNKKAGFPANPGLKYAVDQTIGSGADAPLKRISTGHNLRVGRANETGQWTGNWNEGANRDLSDSYMDLVAGRTFPAGIPFSIIVDRCPNNLVSVSGKPPNYTGFYLEVIGAVHYTKATNPTKINGRDSKYTSTRFTTQMIGDGCRQWNYCNGNGHCDYETGKCICFEGFGGTRNKLYAAANTFLPDCSARSCPTGPAFAALPTRPQFSSPPTYLRSSFQNLTEVGMHREIECGNNGICDRETGKCKCFAGFEGNACQKMLCPRPYGSTDKSQPVCSDRGVCKKQRYLGADPKALPLSTATVRYDAPFMNGSRSSWDADMGHACVCDSRWPVGLTNGTTQLGEFFGPACEFQRCPSGNDPKTPADETDCAGKAQAGTELGQTGNKCHVDCSNQGTCDYTTGICVCFEDFWGLNCGSWRSNIAGGTDPRMRSKPISKL